MHHRENPVSKEGFEPDPGVQEAVLLLFLFSQ